MNNFTLHLKSIRGSRHFKVLRNSGRSNNGRALTIREIPRSVTRGFRAREQRIALNADGQSDRSYAAQERATDA